MHRLLLLPVAALIASVSLAAAAQSSPGTQPGAPATEDRRRTREFVLGTVLKPGDAGDRVREVQATLNRKLHELSDLGRISLRQDNYRVRMDGPVAKLLILRSGIELNLRDVPPNQWRAYPSENSLELPAEPLKVDGIYGQQTYAAVLLFQVLTHLQETGTVDVVTLDKLEPMIPSPRLLAWVMRLVEESWVRRRLEEVPWITTNPPLLTKRCTAIVTTFLILCIAILTYWIARAAARTPRVL